MLNRKTTLVQLLIALSVGFLISCGGGKSTSENEADAFLFTYVEIGLHDQFLHDVVQDWQARKSKYKRKPILYLTYILFAKVERNDVFVLLRTVEIHQDKVVLWHDTALAEMPLVEDAIRTLVFGDV